MRSQVGEIDNSNSKKFSNFRFKYCIEPMTHASCCTLLLTRKVHRSELTDLGENFQIRANFSKLNSQKKKIAYRFERDKDNMLFSSLNTLYYFSVGRVLRSLDKGFRG